MPFTAKTPLEVSGVIYPYVGVSLITSPGFSQKSVGGRVVLNLEPYAIDENGDVVRPMKTVVMEDEEGNPVERLVPDEQYTSRVFYGNVFTVAQENPALGAALSVISAGIQGFINEDLEAMGQNLNAIAQSIQS